MAINTNYWTTEDYANYGLIDPNTGGLTDSGMGAMNTGSFTPQASGPNWGAVASSGLGSVLALAPKLIGMAEQRRTQKKIAKIQKELEAKQWADRLKDYSESQADIYRAGDKGRPSLSADMAERGLSSSSIKTQEMGDLNYALDRRMDALLRKKALDVWGHEAAAKIAKIQKKSERRQYYLQIAAEVGNAIGNAAGAVGGAALSDREAKENIKPVNTKEELKSIEETPVKSWNYKQDKVNPRLGPMAQDVKKNMGEEASNGKEIDLVSMVGKQAAAIQELAKEVRELKNGKR